MSLIAWIVVGLVVGFLAKLVMPDTEDASGGLLGTLILGVVGAVIGGWIWNIALNQPGTTGIDIGSIFIAFIGAIILIGVLRLFTRRGITQ
ncbi:MAG: GlsB/YeaQ/YmgE family stress response membrane protein [Chthonomonadales bacterium]|nr:GlsB/YeaQ/YmgE family stress response membrane protein [Chthonomonadales bacterium]